MNRAFKIMLSVTAVLVALTVAAFLFMLYTMQAGSGVGTIGGIFFMIVALPSFLCVMLTVGLWMFQRNRAATEMTNVVEKKSDEDELKHYVR